MSSPLVHRRQLPVSGHACMYLSSLPCWHQPRPSELNHAPILYIQLNFIICKYVTWLSQGSWSVKMGLVTLGEKTALFLLLCFHTTLSVDGTDAGEYLAALRPMWERSSSSRHLAARTPSRVHPGRFGRCYGCARSRKIRSCVVRLLQPLSRCGCYFMHRLRN